MANSAGLKDDINASEFMYNLVQTNEAIKKEFGGEKQKTPAEQAFLQNDLKTKETTLNETKKRYYASKYYETPEDIQALVSNVKSNVWLLMDHIRRQPKVYFIHTASSFTVEKDKYTSGGSMVAREEINEILNQAIKDKERLELLRSLYNALSALSKEPAANYQMLDKSVSIVNNFYGQLQNLTQQTQAASYRQQSIGPIPVKKGDKFGPGGILEISEVSNETVQVKIEL